MQQKVITLTGPREERVLIDPLAISAIVELKPVTKLERVNYKGAKTAILLFSQKILISESIDEVTKIINNGDILSISPSENGRV